MLASPTGIRVALATFEVGELGSAVAKLVQADLIASSASIGVALAVFGVGEWW